MMKLMTVFKRISIAQNNELVTLRLEDVGAKSSRGGERLRISFFFTIKLTIIKEKKIIMVTEKNKHDGWAVGECRG